MAYYNPEELAQIGFRSVGAQALLSKKATILRPDLISIGSNVRIDDFCVISPSSAPFDIGSYVHIGPFCALIGAEAIVLKDFAGLSARVTVYSSSDDYSGEWLTNPTVPTEYRHVHSAPVTLGRHVIVGTGAAILPGVAVGDGSAIAAMSLVNRPLPESIIAGGQPCRVIKPRSKNIFALGEKLASRRSGKS